MRPLRLVLTAFGPFARREEIDFTRLPPDALFLIHGPTGAGKTSILDGICYALYGETSGSERSAKEMRSHHAADDTLTEVEFEFALGRKRYRVRRSPEQERAALRGKKEQRVKIPARAELQVWDDEGWMPVVSKTTEVTDHIEAILGFKADQFRQVILLPQGQFRKLLTADSKEREQILETLFATETCKRLQERLKAAANALERQAEEAKARKKTLLEQAGVESEEALGARIEEATARRSLLAEEERRRRTEEANATAALAAAEALARQFEERDGARAALDKLSAAAAAIATRRRELDAASRAQFVRAAHANFEEAAAQRQRLAQQLAQAEREVEAAVRQLAAAESRLQEERARAPDREQAIRELERLEGLREAVRTLDEARREAE
ncbi:MAG: AAA family ATPase, partial [Tepidiphilus sp.]|nr:AAA family ATPase [Tepidiphilus sp.]